MVDPAVFDDLSRFGEIATVGNTASSFPDATFEDALVTFFSAP